MWESLSSTCQNLTIWRVFPGHCTSSQLGWWLVNDNLVKDWFISVTKWSKCEGRFLSAYFPQSLVDFILAMLWLKTETIVLYKTIASCTFLICSALFPLLWQKKPSTNGKIYNDRSHFCKWFLETPHGSGQRVINNISTVSSVPVQVFADNPAGTKAMWTEKESKGNCLLPINQCSAL